MEWMTIFTAIFSQNGLLATLFTGLLVWVLKTNNDRETRYITTIDNLTTELVKQNCNTIVEIFPSSWGITPQTPVD